MNDHQKDRLLKIAETNPELAKDVVDILKQDSQPSKEPIAVKMVKSEEDKIEITAEQRKYAIAYLISCGLAVFLVFGFVISVFIITEITFLRADQIIIFAPLIIFLFIACIFSSWYCAYKAGTPTIKTYMSRHFKWS